MINANQGAFPFWSRVIGDFTRGDYTLKASELNGWQWKVFTFESRPKDRVEESQP